jgi:hypothetical protein
MLLALAGLISIQGPDGQTIWVNPDHVVSIRRPRGVEGGHWHKDVKCLVMTNDGKFFASLEACDALRARLDASR